MLDRFKASLFGKKTTETDTSDETAQQPEKHKSTHPGWIGVDLDGTLAEYTQWKGIDHIGRPVPLMLKRVQTWVDAGYQVKVMTARASVPEGAKPVQDWLKKQGLPELEVTNQKDFEMLELWDDRAIQVVANSGRPVLRPSQSSKSKAPLLPNEAAGETFENVFHSP